MFQQAVGVVDETKRRGCLDRPVTVAIDITTSWPFTGSREGKENQILGTTEDTNDYTYHWAPVQIVDADPEFSEAPRLHVVTEEELPGKLLTELRSQPYVREIELQWPGDLELSGANRRHARYREALCRTTADAPRGPSGHGGVGPGIVLESSEGTQRLFSAGP